MEENNQRYIPEPVKRLLRREAFFGCAKCGNPILEYHHIIPWAEQHHNDHQHMIALCPTHHRQLGKLNRQKSYDLKKSPHNKTVGKLYGELGTDKNITKFLVGSNTFEDTPIIFSYYRQPIIRYVIEDRQALLDIYIPKADMWPDVYIRRNDLIVNTGEMWDIEFKTNYLKVRKKSGQSYLEVDFRKDVALINGTFCINGEEFRFNPNSTNFSGTTIKNSYMSRCGSGIAVSDGKHRLLWPNFAMLSPKATYARL